MKLFEHLAVDISKKACADLQTIIDDALSSCSDDVRIELTNLSNELRARLQREGGDVKVTIDGFAEEEWLK